MSAPSQREPQLEPADHVYVLLQDHGPGNGGWGPAAAIGLPGMEWMGPIVYTGSDTATIEQLHEIARIARDHSGKPTILARYTVRLDELVLPGR